MGVFVYAPIGVEEGLVFESEARHLRGCVAEGVVGPFEDFFGGCVLKIFVYCCVFRFGEVGHV